MLGPKLENHPQHLRRTNVELVWKYYHKQAQAYAEKEA